MWIKLLGAGIIIICGWLFGKNLSDKLKKRQVSLNVFHKALMMLESEISFSQNSMDRAFLNISKSVGEKEFFKNVAEKVKENGAREAWREAVSEYKESLGLTKEDAEIISSLSGELGATDRDNQIKNIRYVLSRLEGAEKEAAEKYSSLARLYRSISLGAAAASAILLM